MIEFNATILICMISFVVFMFIMNVIFYKPILEIVKKRQNYISYNASQTEMFTSQAEEATRSREEKILDAKIVSGQKLKTSLDAFRSEADKLIKSEKDNSKNNILLAKNSLEKEAQSVKLELDKNVIGDIADYMVQKAQ